MKRDLNTLSNTEFDIVIIGAGIYGVTTAWDASLRGLKVALIDKDDFGNATSSNSLKTIHGGLRYLQQLDIKRMRESFRERMVLMRIAPNLVSPIKVVMPTYGYKLKSRPAVAAALIVNDIIGFDRNRLTDPNKFMPGGFTISKKKVQNYIEGYEKNNMNGGAVWYDCQCYNTERLLLSFVISAVDKGANAANYVKAIEFLKNGNKISGVKVQDTLDGKIFDIKARLVINNTGPWIDNVLNNVDGKIHEKKFVLSKAMNLVVKRKLFNNNAAGLSGPYKYIREDGSVYKSFRILFFAPWRDYTIIGTNHVSYDGHQDDYKVTEAEIQDFLADANQAYPAAKIKREEVTFFYSGILPMAKNNPCTGKVILEKHYKLYDHYKLDGLEGLISVIGVKYTTARDVAKKTIDMAGHRLNQKLPKSTTDKTPLYGGEIENFEEFKNNAINTRPHNLDATVMKHLSYNYGSAYFDILNYAVENPEWVKTIADSNEVLKAEIIHGIREEMAHKLSDVILRRTDVGSVGNPGKKCLEDAAQIMANELGWDKARIKKEIEDVENIYIPA